MLRLCLDDEVQEENGGDDDVDADVDDVCVFVRAALRRGGGGVGPSFVIFHVCAFFFD